MPGTVSGKPAASTALRPMLTRLLADLHDAAHDHVVDERGIEVVALDERLQRLGGEVDRVPVRQLAVALAASGADGVDDDGGAHASCPLWSRSGLGLTDGSSLLTERRSVQPACERFQATVGQGGVMAWASIEEVDRAVAGQTVPRVFLKTVAANADGVALRCMDARGRLEGMDVQRVRATRSATAAAALQGLGLSAGDKVVLMMRNRPDFHWLDMAAQFLRITPVSIYNSSSVEEIMYLVDALRGAGRRSSRTAASSSGS